MIPAFEATAAFAPDLAPAGRAAPPSRVSQWLRRVLRSLRAVPPEALDRSTGLYNRAGLFAATNEILRHRAGHVPVSAIVLEFAELHEVREIYGAAIARKVVARVVSRLRAVAGLGGLVGRTGPTQFTIVFARAGGEKALRSLHRALGKPARVEFDAGDSEIVLVPDFVVDELERGASTIQPLCRDLSRELARLQGAERRRLRYLTHERERHSRPMAIRH